MRSFCLLLALFTRVVFSSPFKVVVDRPGQWEFEWSRTDYRTDTGSDGGVRVSLRGISTSDVPGDLAAPRLQALLALPATGSWKLEVVQDSGKILAGASWSRDRKSTRLNSSH